MNKFDASDPNTGFVLCAVCEKAITGGHWTARIKREGHVVALCCPLCTETFEARPHVYLRRIEMLNWNDSSRESQSP